MVKKVLLKNVPTNAWDRIEINWGKGNMISWLQQLAQAIEKAGKLIVPYQNKGFDFVGSDERKELDKWQSVLRKMKVNKLGLKQIAQSESSLSDYDEKTYTLIPNNWQLREPFNDYSTQSVYEDIAFMLWGGTDTSKIFYHKAGKVGTIKSKEALEYLQKIAGELEVEYQEVRNIIIIGRTNQGKSSLANVLLNKNNDFERVFEEGICDINEIKDVQSETFEHNGIKYQIVDTIGLDDKSRILNNKSKKLRQAILVVAKACKKVEDGLNHVLFVIGDRFAREDVETYKILRKVLFDEGIAEYTIIVRTKFDNFKSKGKCETDIERTIREDNTDIIEMVESCDKKIIHVNNPSIDISGDSEGEDSDIGAEINVNKRVRNKSREKLLEYLEKDCQETYKPENLDKINEKIDNFAWEEIETLKRKFREKKGELNEAKRRKDETKKELLEGEIDDLKKEICEKEELLQNTIFNTLTIVWNRVKYIESCRIM